MFLYPDEEGRGRIVGAVLSQAQGNDYPTLSVDVQIGTHVPSAIYGTPREPCIHGAMIKVHGEAVVPFMAQMMAEGLPVVLYPSNGGDEETWLRYVRREVP